VERVSELIEPVAESLGYELVRVRFSGRTLQVMAERPDGTMRIEDCTALSRALSQALDAADPIAESYNLEVSSPGIDRPLTRPKDFANWAGHEAKFELKDAFEGRRRVRGLLRGLRDGDVVIEVEDKGRQVEFAVPLREVAEAKLVLTDELLKRAAREPVDESKFDAVEVEE
jgi:ribosome maturation factor RimP